MRVKFNEKGVLTIVATTGVERYALEHWWKNYEGGDKSSMLSLEYETFKEDYTYQRDFH
jgi:hypothetical protein